MGDAVGRAKRGKRSQIIAIINAAGLPVAACLASASTHEVKLAETALNSLFIAEKPEKFIGGRVYDSDKLDDDLLRKHGVEMVAPHRRNRTKPKTQDGRKQRRYQRRSAGKLNGFLLGFKTSGDWLSDMSGMLIIFWLSYCLLARLFWWWDKRVNATKQLLGISQLNLIDQLVSPTTGYFTSFF